ncbi:MAG: DUF4149 domain-containing protein [Pseudomonadota bacterium]
MTDIGLYLALYALAILFGGMVAFSALFAPLVFTQLPMETAAKFIRATFPRYYLFILATSVAATVGLTVAGVPPHLAIVAAAIALATVHARWVLMPKINALRDAELAGDAAAGAGFKLRHRISVLVNVVQLLLAGYLLAHLV